ncbi:tellurite-resistance/dicarboxylate transporter family protein [Aspergillus aculeatinus CBS 121060]|uniref:C4-dicarboxylate transporter/malic acid transport protein n=2 Tax=Aspergillus TaxID=5052 RepID=A0A8G1W657_9EURO|nr:C4-dicarboxylate transporter/malic acid transport protein [Aspergillus aculeatinus CBS 121060]XP_040805944.1 C4-dicarboxylate transporter/malic acid transport protein [Aspergillus fijiensis CBS 313.89]RAH73800.1 C4-dicarboxylate transporter/malic acid transport protein [Aspergillus aculeatinus CBS 121060]RAK81934.1 C4-dicarboxylate transporter/malic acid transport protein [Aspergillus fijiensis CBS 313.89]
MHDHSTGSSPYISDVETLNHACEKSVNPETKVSQPQESPIISNNEHQEFVKLGIRQRLRHFTWAWYTLTMSAGGLALLLRNQPYQFKGLKEIGLVVYIANLVFFTIIGSLMITRFVLYNNLMDSLRHDREGFFFPTFWLSIATMISGLSAYFSTEDTHRLNYALEGLFWAYCIFTFASAVIQYSFVFSYHTFPLQTMMPSWILPAFPIMLSGTIASAASSYQPAVSATPMIVAGITFQGLGFCISFMMYAHYIGRLMETGIPSSEHRPGMFICVGPPAFTLLAIIGMANGLPEGFSILGDGGMDDRHIMRVLAVCAGMFLWALSIWFFCVALGSVVRAPPHDFHLNWWAMVFPNTGLTLATITLAKSLDSAALKWVGVGMSLCVICMFIFVFVSTIRAVLLKRIMWPGRDEDVSELFE